MKKIILLFTLLLIFIIAPTWAADAFVVRDIKIQGLQRISAETVYSYLPIKRGQSLSADKTRAVIKDLYKTGFFDHITLARSGNTLIIRVIERPTIGQLKISGNSVITTEKLTTVMKSVDVAEGRVYNRAMIDKIKQSLLNQYYELGRYNARVDVVATPQARNRMLVTIDISEGLVAKIARISIIGNHAFSERQLLKQLTISTPGIFTIFTQTDRYSQEKIDKSLESLRNFYLDHGYVKFAVKSAQVAITPDRKSVYVTIAIEEGVPYTIRGYELTGNLILPRGYLLSLMRIRAGDTFSRQEVINSEKAISDALGDKGYIYATVVLQPQIDDVKKEVFLTFEVKPGKRSYVRHIYFSDNAKTNDLTLRRELLQMEAAVVSTSKLDQSKRRLGMLPYIKDVQMSVLPVSGQDDQVDVHYKVAEESAATANFNVNYSQTQRWGLGAGINQKNFLGTGNTLGLNFSLNRFERSYALTYYEPYYTLDGISRSITLSVQRVDPGAANLSTSYVTDDYNASVLYGIPFGNEKNAINRLLLGYGYQETLLHKTSKRNDATSIQVVNFVNSHGRHFQQLDLSVGLSRDSRDRAIFPTSGMIQTLGLDVYVPAQNRSLHYYMANYSNKVYLPLTPQFILTERTLLGYGNGFSGANQFPFFKNYFAGGIETVHGYAGNTLGPRDSNTQPFGGNLLAVASLGLIFPNYLSDNLRTTAFVDGGNVFNTYNNQKYGGTSSGPLRFSTGVQADWLTSFGLISVSLSKALNANRGSSNGGLNDNVEPFQFALGANLG